MVMAMMLLKLAIVVTVLCQMSMSVQQVELTIVSRYVTIM